MSKHWKPGRQTVAVRPSRIRRDPVPVAKPKVQQPDSPEFEMWGGVAGILLFAAALVVVTVGVAIATFSKYDPAAEAAHAARFDQCYNAGGSNCVLDGGTIYFLGEKVKIAGIDAPQIQGARCPQEAVRGREAAVQLLDLLHGGQVTVGAIIRDQDGRAVRKVQVNGEDVGKAMIDAGVAREYGSSEPDWCAPADESSDSDT